jgi:hypothetical protein
LKEVFQHFLWMKGMGGPSGRAIAFHPFLFLILPSVSLFMRQRAFRLPIFMGIADPAPGPIIVTEPAFSWTKAHRHPAPPSGISAFYRRSNAMKANTANIPARLRFPGAAAHDTPSHDTPNVMQPAKPLRRISTGLAAALTLGLFALPGVSRADVYIDGTQNWDGSTSWHTTNGGGLVDLGPNPAVSGMLGIGTGSAEWGVPEWLGWGTLNQTGGTVTTGSGMWIGFNWAATGSSAYHMSGTAAFSDAANPSEIGRFLSATYPGQTYTWSLADSATATVGSLSLGLPDSYLLLSGASTFTTTVLLDFYDSSDYISFATGSTATFTAADEDLASYTALVTTGNIRVDGVVQTDFSKFQVTGNTLSLIPEPSATLLGGLGLLSLLRRRR